MPDRTKFKINLPVSDLAGGGFEEKLQGEMRKVFENIHDPNTSPTDKREINVKFKMTPDEERELVTIEMDFTTKLAPVLGVAQKVVTGKDLGSNTIEAYALKSGTPGQTFIDEDGEVKTDNGQPVDVIEKEMSQKANVHQLKRGNE